MLLAKKGIKNQKKKLGTLRKMSLDCKPGPSVKTKFPKTLNDISPLQEKADLLRDAQVKHVHFLSHANLP